MVSRSSAVRAINKFSSNHCYLMIGYFSYLHVHQSAFTIAASSVVRLSSETVREHPGVTHPPPVAVSRLFRHMPGGRGCGPGSRPPRCPCGHGFPPGSSPAVLVACWHLSWLSPAAVVGAGPCHPALRWARLLMPRAGSCHPALMRAWLLAPRGGSCHLALGWASRSIWVTGTHSPQAGRA